MNSLDLYTLADLKKVDSHRVDRLGGLLRRAWIRRCKKENRNLLIVIVGDTGSGKSWAGLELAKKLDRRFNINRVVFSPVDLIRLVRSKLTPGSAIMLDEAQIPADHRKWFSATVNAIRYITQTARFKNNILIFTTPDMDLIDSDARKLFHYMIEMRRVDYKHNVSIGDIAEIVRASHATSLTATKPWRVFPRIITKDRTYVISTLRFRRPPKKLREAYEKKKEEFMDQFYLKLENDLADLTKEELSLAQIADQVIEALDIYRSSKPGKLVLHKLMLDFSLSRDKAKQVEILVNRKLKQADYIKKVDEEIARQNEELKAKAIKKKKKRIATMDINMPEIERLE